MTNLDGLGKRVQDARKKRNWDVPTFARQVGCKSQLIKCIEESKLHEPHALFSVLERMANVLSISLEDLLFGHSTAWTARVNEMKVAAFRIIWEKSLTDSVAIVDKVFGQIEFEHDQAVATTGEALAFRQREKLFEIDEDRVRDLVESAKRPSDDLFLGFDQ